MAQQYKLTIAHPHLQKILSVLAEQPFKQVNPIIVSLMQQSEAQDKAEAIAAQKTADAENAKVNGSQPHDGIGQNEGEHSHEG